MRRYILTFWIISQVPSESRYCTVTFNVFRITTKAYDGVVKGITESDSKIQSVILINSLELDIEDGIK